MTTVDYQEVDRNLNRLIREAKENDNWVLIHYLTFQDKFNQIKNEEMKDTSLENKCITNYYIFIKKLKNIWKNKILKLINLLFMLEFKTKMLIYYLCH